MTQSFALDQFRAKRQRFDGFAALYAYHRALFDLTRADEARLSYAAGTHPIYYHGGTGKVDVAVKTPPMFLDMYNFRESFFDPTGLSARQRLLLLAVLSRADKGSEVGLFEQGTAFADALHREELVLETSYYTETATGDDVQDMQNMRYPNDRFDFLVHGDVLEHVPDTAAALRECFRVLRPGGTMMFTAPFFPMEKSVLRAEIGPDGQLIRHLPDEIHGDYLTGGILAFHNFGWALIETLRSIGFQRAYVEECYNPDLGFFTSNCPLWTTSDPLQIGNMLPMIIVAEKGRVEER